MKKKKVNEKGKLEICAGIGLGAVGVAGTAISGVVCPICVIGAPLLIGIGAYKRWKSKNQIPCGDNLQTRSICSRLQKGGVKRKVEDRNSSAD